MPTFQRKVPARTYSCGAGEVGLLVEADVLVGDDAVAGRDHGCRARRSRSPVSGRVAATPDVDDRPSAASAAASATAASNWAMLAMMWSEWKAVNTASGSTPQQPGHGQADRAGRVARHRLDEQVLGRQLVGSISRTSGSCSAPARRSRCARGGAERLSRSIVSTSSGRSEVSGRNCFGIGLPRQRPEAGARAAAEDDRVVHRARMVIIATPARRPAASGLRAEERARCPRSPRPTCAR